MASVSNSDLAGYSSLSGRLGYMARGRSLLALPTRFYVVDSGRNRIVKFSPDGQVLASWGSEGTGDGQFRGPSLIARSIQPTTKCTLPTR